MDIDGGTHTFDHNANRVIELFERLERDRMREARMKSRHGGGETSGSWNMSFVAQEQGVEVANYASRQKFGVKVEPRDKQSNLIECFKCHQMGHTADSCPAVGTTSYGKCFSCGGIGHRQRDCPSFRQIVTKNWGGRGFSGRGGPSNGRGGNPNSGRGFAARSPSNNKRPLAAVTIRNSDGTSREKLSKNEFVAYRCHMDDIAAVLKEDRGTGEGKEEAEEEEEEAVLTSEEELWHDHVMEMLSSADSSSKDM